MRRLTYEYVKDYFEEQECKMLDKWYRGALDKINYECSCGNTSKITFNNFKVGKKCGRCKNDKISKKLRLDYDYVRKYFEKNGCEMLDDFYINTFIKINYKCSCGNIEYISFNKFLMKKYRCCSKCTLSQNRGENRWNWIKNRKELKEINNFKNRCRSLLRHSLISTGKSKISKTYNMLGYTYAELKNYIYNHPNWTRVKDNKWHLDHIFPLRAFVDYGISDIKLINSFDNLQPLLAIENLNKNAKYNKEKFEKWLRKKKVKF